MGVSGSTSKLLDNKYNYGERLGKGAFGMVYKATPKDVIISKYPNVAIKLLSCATTEIRQKAAKQAEILCTLNHPGIIDFVECYIHPPSGDLAIVTEFCCMGNLQSYLEKYRPDITKRYNWYKQLASAVQYMHGKNIAHCDIKPTNIVLDYGKLKLCDVGLARAYHQIANPLMSYQEYLLSFNNESIFYMPPEILANEIPASECDIYCLGLVFLMITESPSPVIPQAKDPTTGAIVPLGELLNRIGACAVPCNYLSIMYATKKEKALLNNMLAYSSLDRFSTDKVLRVVKNLKVSQEEEKNQLDLCIQNLSTQLANLDKFLDHVNSSIKGITGFEVDTVRDGATKTAAAMNNFRRDSGVPNLLQLAKNYLDLLSCCDAASERCEATSKRLENDVRQKTEWGVMLGAAGFLALAFAISVDVAIVIAIIAIVITGIVADAAHKKLARYKTAAEKLSKKEICNPQIAKTCHLIQQYGMRLAIY